MAKTPTFAAEAWAASRRFGPMTGLTLLELLVVISILSALALAAGGLVARDGPTSQAAAREVARALRLARADALRTGQDVVMTYDAQAHSFGASPRLVALPQGMAINGAGPVRFFAEGGASGGPLILTDAENDREGFSHIHIRPLTGAVLIGDPRHAE